MWFLGLEVSVAELLTLFTGIVVLCILYLAYEIYKLKRVEARLEAVEKRFEKDEKKLERAASRKGKKKKA